MKICRVQRCNVERAKKKNFKLFFYIVGIAPLHLRIFLIYFLGLCLWKFAGCKGAMLKGLYYFCSKLLELQLRTSEFFQSVLGFGSVWLWKSAEGVEDGVAEVDLSVSEQPCKWVMVHGTDAFTHLTGFLLDGFIICGGRVGFLNLIVKMFLVSAARLSFEGSKGAHVVQSQAPKTGSQNIRISGFIWR